MSPHASVDGKVIKHVVSWLLESVTVGGLLGAAEDFCESMDKPWAENHGVRVLSILITLPPGFAITGVANEVISCTTAPQVRFI